MTDSEIECLSDDMCCQEINADVCGFTFQIKHCYFNNKKASHDS